VNYIIQRRGVKIYLSTFFKISKEKWKGRKRFVFVCARGFKEGKK